ncbi:DUF2511 domain-containing protein [Photobacterium leiognathi]|uniref:DUF2511 domain-containing protein n=1 Tax=Photobacterium leiognathi TaxID=553611 RepID=UPI001EDF079D|nr:DUF2511 domain-containing protein [Photobacterium leiognathi]MCG3887420.1 DUF2511 domain-containing protein [Photobacterium leiognathi]
MFVWYYLHFLLHSFASERQVSFDEFGNEWPLTVNSGTIECRQGNSVVFITDGKEYAINGTAEDLGYKDIRPIWKDDTSTGIVEYAQVVANDEGISLEEAVSQLGGLPKVNINPLIQIGLALCE